MRRQLTRLTAWASVAAMLLPTAALAKGPIIAKDTDPNTGTRWAPETRYEVRYLKARTQFKQVIGIEEAGRNIVIDEKCLDRAGGECIAEQYARPQEIKDRTAQMRDAVYLALHPPAPEPMVSTTSSYSGSSGGLPECTYGPESGGDYGAYNESSGATGKYQIIPSTASSYGCDLSTPAGQDACAAEIYADVGGSAWVNC